MARMRIPGVIVSGLMTSVALTGGGMTSPKAQTDVDSRLPMAGIESPDDARAFIARFQEAAAAGAREDLANMIAYPLTIYANGDPVATYDTPTALLGDFEAVFSADVLAAIEGARYEDLFVRDQGAMIGQGEIWFVGWDGPLRIKSINP